MSEITIPKRTSNIEHRTVQPSSLNVGCWTFLFLLSSILCPPPSVHAQAPQLINYQGRLLDGTNLVNGNVGLSLRLFNVASGGTSLYEDSNTVTVVDGLYATHIGDHPTNVAFVAALTNAELWVEVAVNGTTLSPRERMASVAYALAVRGLQAKNDGGIVLNPALGANVLHDTALHSAIGGGFQNQIGTDSLVSVIGGGEGNQVGNSSAGVTIGGGSLNVVANDSSAATVGGGGGNDIGAHANSAFIGGGSVNAVADYSQSATIAGGANNDVGSYSAFAVIAGGQNNEVAGESTAAAIGGGWDNVIGTNAAFAFIGGGLGNLISNSATYAIIPGGVSNRVAAGATNAFAAGRQAQANHRGAFVWGDDTTANLPSTNANSVTLRASGGYRFFSNAGATLGAQLAPNATAWAAISDRNAKENFAPIDTTEILDQVAQLPLTAWTYKADPEHRRYIGPVAQDFHAAFGLGNDTTISTLDADGVALASIQALAEEDRRQRTEDRGRQDQINALKSENAELMKRLDRLERELQGIRQERDR